MTILNASKSDVRNPRLEQKDSLQLEPVTTSDRDSKEIQLIGDMVFNTDSQSINVNTLTGWSGLLKSNGTLPNNGILFTDGAGQITADPSRLSYNVSSENILAVNTRTYLNGGLRTASRTVGDGQPIVIITRDDYTLSVVTTNNAVDVQLPGDISTEPGTTFQIHDATGNALINNITITTFGVFINGSNSFVMNQNYQSITLRATGSQWILV